MITLPQNLYDELSEKESLSDVIVTQEKVKDILQKKETTQEQVIQKEKERITDPKLSSTEKKVYRALGKSLFQGSKTALLAMKNETTFARLMSISRKSYDFIKKPIDAVKKVTKSGFVVKNIEITAIAGLLYILARTFFGKEIDDMLERIKPFLQKIQSDYIGPAIDVISKVLDTLNKAKDNLLKYFGDIENLKSTIKGFFDTSNNGKNSLVSLCDEAIQRIIEQDIFGNNEESKIEIARIKEQIEQTKAELSDLMKNNKGDIQDINNQAQLQWKTQANVIFSKEVAQTISDSFLHDQKFDVKEGVLHLNGKPLEATPDNVRLVYDSIMNNILNTAAGSVGFNYNPFTQDETLLIAGSKDIDKNKVMQRVIEILSKSPEEVDRLSGKIADQRKWLLATTNGQLTSMWNRTSTDIEDIQRPLAKNIQTIYTLNQVADKVFSETGMVEDILEARRQAIGEMANISRSVADTREVLNIDIQNVPERERGLFMSIASLRRLIEGFFLGGGSNGINEMVSNNISSLLPRSTNNDYSMSDVYGGDNASIETDKNGQVKEWTSGLSVRYDLNPEIGTVNDISIDTTNTKPLETVLGYLHEYITHFTKEVLKTNKELENTAAILGNMDITIKENEIIKQNRHNNDTVRNLERQPKTERNTVLLREAVNKYNVRYHYIGEDSKNSSTNRAAISAHDTIETSQSTTRIQEVIDQHLIIPVDPLRRYVTFEEERFRNAALTSFD